MRCLPGTLGNTCFFYVRKWFTTSRKSFVWHLLAYFIFFLVLFIFVKVKWEKYTGIFYRRNIQRQGYYSAGLLPILHLCKAFLVQLFHSFAAQLCSCLVLSCLVEWMKLYGRTRKNFILYKSNRNNCLHITDCKNHHVSKWAGLPAGTSLFSSPFAGVKQLGVEVLHGFNFCLGSYWSGNVSICQSTKFWIYLKQQMFVFPFEYAFAKVLFSSFKKLFKIIRVWFSPTEYNCNYFKVLLVQVWNSSRISTISIPSAITASFVWVANIFSEHKTK